MNVAPSKWYPKAVFGHFFGSLSQAKVGFLSMKCCTSQAVPGRSTQERLRVARVRAWYSAMARGAIAAFVGHRPDAGESGQDET